MGNHGVINSGDIQVMSAGSGIEHSEYNANDEIDASILQIWLFTKTKDVEPRYQQISLDENKIKNDLLQIVSPNPDDEGTWIHQDAWFFMGQFDNEKELQYKLKKNGNGVYIFVIDGEIDVEGEKLSKRDGIGIWETNTINIRVSNGSKILIMDIPMQN
jgi:redox-sensitive bicupin YhaK (pirin superfamily)